MKNNKKVEKKVLTEEEEYLLNELADIFVEGILYELKEEGINNPDFSNIELS